MAIAVAVASPPLDLVALTTVFGNHNIDVTTANAQRVLDHLGVPDITVVRGAAAPLVRPISPPATFVHGDDGLGDAGFAEPSRSPYPGRAASFIIDSALADPGALTLVAIGPLTNLALALRIEPAIASAFRQVVIMGGAATVAGNVTPAAEANIWNDPHAAEIVFSAGLPLTMIGLDVTHQLLADLDWLRNLDQHDTSATELITRTAPAYLQFHKATDGLDGIHCHDVATIAYLLAPDLFETVPMRVRVVTDGFSAGATVVDRSADPRPEWSDRPAVDVAIGVDVEGVLDLVEFHLARSQPA